MELGRERSGAWTVAEQLAPDALERTLERERTERDYPRVPSDEDLRPEEDRAPCGCAECRRGSIFDDEDELGDDDLFEDELAGMPPELAAAMGEFMKYVDREGRLPTPEELLRRDPALANRLADALVKAKGPPPPRGGRRRRR